MLKYIIASDTYFTNEVAATMDTSPMIWEGRTMMPIRYVAEPLGAEVDWNSDEQRVRVVLDDKTADLWIGQNAASINGNRVAIDTENTNVCPIVNASGRTMLPLRFIAEQLGASVDWNEGRQEITITYPSH